ncbi:MAG: FAD/NAD(P)-binding oxidoreductase, partial [Dehalococcoidia bacterium]
MRVCIVGGGGGASNAANVIRRLDKDVQIDIFTDRAEIGNQPCEIPFVLKGDLPSWGDTFVFKRKFYGERNINVHFNTEVTGIIRTERRLIAGEENYDYDKLILDLGAIPAIPPIPGI